MSERSISLFYSDLNLGGNSDKEYRIHLVKASGGYVVNIEYGRRGSTMRGSAKIASPVSLEEATAVFERVEREQLRQGYVPQKFGTPSPSAPAFAPTDSSVKRSPYPIEDLEELATEDEADLYLRSDKYWLQKKNNGEFRQIQKLADGTYLGYNKLGLVVSSLPAEIVYELKKMKAKTFFLAGELVGNKWIGENLLELNGEDFSKRSYKERFNELEGLILAGARHVILTTTWKTAKQKTQGRAALQRSRAEGEVHKLISAVYRSGSSRNHRKFKYVKTLSALVVKKGEKGHNSATIGLYEGDKIIVVGHCSLNGKQNVDVGSVVEVRYLFGTEGKRLYQARLPKGKAVIRTDVDPRKCTTDQIIYQEGVTAA